MLAAVERSAVAIVVLDAGGVVQRWSPGAERLFGFTAAESEGRHWVDVGLVADPLRRRRVSELLATTLDGGLPVSREWVARRADGTAVRVHTVQEPMLDPEGGEKPIGLVTLSFDLSDREGFEADLVREALQDRLTRLPIRSVLHHALANRIAACSDGPSPCAAVLFVDLDRFKSVNDTYGHDVGDRVLIEVARRLRAAVRTDDVVARVGGDEFVVLVPMAADDTAADVTARVAAALARPIPVGDDTEVDVAASIGVALATPDDDPADVLRRADSAMYRAKGSSAATAPG